MDKKIALKWARALESGAYPQGQGALRSSEGLCCLGVLCNLHALEHPEIAAEQKSPNSYMGEEATLPRAVMDWAGICWSDSAQFEPGFRFEVKKDQRKAENRGENPEYANDLIELNDHYEWDFKKIAKVIRKHHDKL